MVSLLHLAKLRSILDMGQISDEIDVLQPLGVAMCEV